MDKLLKTIPPLQAQLDALLEFDASPSDLSHGVITAAFMLLFKVSAGFEESTWKDRLTMWQLYGCLPLDFQPPVLFRLSIAITLKKKREKSTCIADEALTKKM